MQNTSQLRGHGFVKLGVPSAVAPRVNGGGKHNGADDERGLRMDRARSQLDAETTIVLVGLTKVLSMFVNWEETEREESWWGGGKPSRLKRV